jgi:hypothetical protein
LGRCRKIPGFFVYEDKQELEEGADMNTPLKKDAWIYRVVVAMLGVTMITSVGGAIALTIAGQPTPDVLVTLGSTAAGSLAGLLAPSPLNK